MARVAWIIEILPGMGEKYDRAHAEAWPSVRQNLIDAGARNFSIYRQGTTVFGYYECDDAEATKKAIAEGEARLRWGDALEGVCSDEVLARGEDYPPEVFRQD